MNYMKTTVLLAALTGMLLFFGNLIGGHNGMLIGLIIAGGMNFFSYWFSDKIVLKMYRARQVSESEAPKLFRIVRNLTMKANMPMPKVYIIPEESPNAFATGRDPQHAAVAATEGILRILSDEELEGVMAHELMHVAHRDTLISTIAATIAGAISYVANMLQWAAMFGRGSDDEEERGSLVGTIALAIVAPIAAMIIQMAISRSREYAADEGAARLSKRPYALASALRKLHQNAAAIPMQSGSAATSSLFIVNPFSGGIAGLFSTHPPMEKRIEKLEALSRQNL
ncbi:MAG: zinc metalloprotease HtpX [Chitinivibrionales bacterium]|nr:zinc metalloprotease HtpX [Chitinivibrionales bacterium]